VIVGIGLRGRHNRAGGRRQYAGCEKLDTGGPLTSEI
jgi:hypothetical protein